MLKNFNEFFQNLTNFKRNARKLTTNFKNKTDLQFSAK